MAHPSHDLGVRTLSTLILFPFGRKPLPRPFLEHLCARLNLERLKPSRNNPRAPIKQQKKAVQCQRQLVLSDPGPVPSLPSDY